MKSTDELGRLVRKAWLEWARQQPDRELHPNWLLPWEELSEGDKEVDRRIGVALACEGYTEAAEIASQQQNFEVDQTAVAQGYNLACEVISKKILAARDKLKAK